MQQVRSIFAERISQGFYVNVEVNRSEAARYGLSVADVQTAVSSGIGGQNIAENIEGRERYPISVRYSQDFRDSVEQMRNVLIATPSGAQIPLGQVARVSFSHGPAMIRDEDGQLTGYVYIDLKSTNYGGFVEEAARRLQKDVSIPASYGYKWSGEYEFELRAKERLKLILPIVFFMIFLLLYIVFHSAVEDALDVTHLSDNDLGPLRLQSSAATVFPMHDGPNRIASLEQFVHDDASCLAGRARNNDPWLDHECLLQKFCRVNP
jgi:Cu(I)/Ag(I) efflux system membrane protein CusA/SilA